MKSPTYHYREYIGENTPEGNRVLSVCNIHDENEPHKSFMHEDLYLKLQFNNFIYLAFFVSMFLALISGFILRILSRSE